uniref:Secreted protein n=1 Tax=Heterorhabditis bacteriophora TaxID=37862 RepID=A0A1I7WDB9_HETBA
MSFRTTEPLSILCVLTFSITTVHSSSFYPLHILQRTSSGIFSVSVSF